MVISCSQAGIVIPERFSLGILNLKRSGFENIFLDLGMYCSGKELENKGNKSKEKRNLEEVFRNCDGFLKECKKHNMEITAVLAPWLLRDTKRTDLNDLLRRCAEESIRLCSRVGCRYLIVRPLFAGIAAGKEWLVNREYYLQLAKTARECNVMILLENQCKDIGGHLVRGLCSDGYAVNEWIDRLNKECGEERFGFCLNSGVCSLCGQDMYELASTVREHIKMVILCECDGRHESAGLPFTSVYQRRSQTDWRGLIRLLREIGFDGQLALDMEDTAAAFSMHLHPQLLCLAKAVMEYFRWQIEIENRLKMYKSIVLFGAGNMCWNYMRCYGEKYPPLFICDNDKRLWGTSVNGLEVKPPEALRGISDECGVFICNIYYQEIEMQLKNMGICNIEFFNDEHLTSFLCERLEGE